MTKTALDPGDHDVNFMIGAVRGAGRNESRNEKGDAGLP
jgi:hypothetical protein